MLRELFSVRGAKYDVFVVSDAAAWPPAIVLVERPVELLSRSYSAGHLLHLHSSALHACASGQRLRLMVCG